MIKQWSRKVAGAVVPVTPAMSVYPWTSLYEKNYNPV